MKRLWVLQNKAPAGAGFVITCVQQGPGKNNHRPGRNHQNSIIATATWPAHRLVWAQSDEMPSDHEALQSLKDVTNEMVASNRPLKSSYLAKSREELSDFPQLPWSDAEDELLIKLRDREKLPLAAVTRELVLRSESAVENRYCFLKKQHRAGKAVAGSSTAAKEVDK